MKAFITGGAGFIGSTMVDRLLAEGHEVTAYDDFSNGRREFLANALDRPHFRLVQGDVLDAEKMGAALRGHDLVFHFAANADVRRGLEHPRRDLEQNTMATFTVLETMRHAGVKRIAFSSTGSIYGEPRVFPTPEDCPFPVQTSLYGASKLAGEGLISAYCEGFGFSGCVFRFVSILGERYNHGHVLDFYKQLSSDPRRLLIQGDGQQRKSYLYVQDCVDAVLHGLRASPAGFHVFNLGTDEYITVNESVAVITRHLGLDPELSYTGGERGWIGDSPFIFLDTRKIRATGWKPTLTIRQAVERTVAYVVAHPELLEEDA
ncbi:MAG TPA: NAD-dependent epimerase/dehydratase family protein [Myxococcales bacterium]|nr:NAD-dependent epimerase/dehydratase family protein [Myxococcales bacterium]